METIRDLWQAYEDGCGASGPERTLDELREEFHRRGFTDYALDGDEFIQAIFADGWAQ